MNTIIDFETAKLLEQAKINGGKKFPRSIFNKATISDVIMWLYQVDNIWIYAQSDGYGLEELRFQYVIHHNDKEWSKIRQSGYLDLWYKTPTKAIIEGIKYILEHRSL